MNQGWDYEVRASGQGNVLIAPNGFEYDVDDDVQLSDLLGHLNTLQSALQEAEAERDAAKALVPYATHLANCEFETWKWQDGEYVECVCGLFALLSSLTPSQTEDAGT